VNNDACACLSSRIFSHLPDSRANSKGIKWKGTHSRHSFVSTLRTITSTVSGFEHVRVCRAGGRNQSALGRRWDLTLPFRARFALAVSRRQALGLCFAERLSCRAHSSTAFARWQRIVSMRLAKLRVLIRAWPPLSASNTRESEHTHRTHTANGHKSSGNEHAGTMTEREFRAYPSRCVARQSAAPCVCVARTQPRPEGPTRSMKNIFGRILVFKVIWLKQIIMKHGSTIWQTRQ
jgi:hypothetical protein